MRIMYDSTSIIDDPVAPLIAYYCDGVFAVSEAAVRARFPHATLVAISAVGTNAGIVGDVEPGCMTILQAVVWVKERRAAGFDPTLYCNETYGWAPVRNTFLAEHVTEPHYWVADYDGVATIPAGAIAKQYENPTLTHGHFDKSVAANYWPGVDGPISGDDMALLSQNDSDALIWRIAVLTGKIKQVDVPKEFQGYTTGVVSVADVKAELDEIKATLAKPEPAETEPTVAPVTPIDPQVAADLHTIAAFLHRFGA
jgi:hypothetical protein